MTEEIKNLLYMAWAYADHMDKSTEWMIQYMVDFAKVDNDTVIEFIFDSTEEERSHWYMANHNWLEEHNEINQKALNKIS